MRHPPPMPRDPRVDAYIARSADFARPILTYLREVMHEAGDVGEDIKWSMPAFLWKGRQVANMAAFKAHASFGFWNREIAGQEKPEGMGQFGRLTSVEDLPPKDRLIEMAQAAMAAAESGATVPRSRKPKPALEMPEDFRSALAAAPAAQAFHDSLPPGARREYLEWIVEARRPETRSRRIETAVAQLAEGKRLNWKHEKR